jgi:formate dehydrogenase major subunit
VIKNDGNLQKLPWDEAIDLAAKNLGRIKHQHGSDALVYLSCERAVNEENFLVYEVCQQRHRYQQY